jgi:large subunit ribosomal protein L10
VAKNTLVRRAIKGTGYEALDSSLGGQIGVILSYEDPVVLAKTFTSFGPLGDKLKLRAAVLDGQPLTPAEVQALAKLPSREVIFGQLLGLLNAPATQLVRLLNEPGSYLARVIDAIGKKNGAGPAEPSAPNEPSEPPPPASAAPADSGEQSPPPAAAPAGSSEG